MAPIQYITGDDLATYIKSGKVPHKDYLVVDVRDSDFAGGNINGAVNLPSRTFYDKVEDLVKSTADTKTMIFHCALSQERGPKAARVYSESRESMLQEEDGDRPRILVLRDGFTKFQLKYKDDPELVVGWDKNVWAAE